MQEMNQKCISLGGKLTAQRVNAARTLVTCPVQLTWCDKH